MGDLGGPLVDKLLHFHVVLMAIAAWVILWALRKMWKGMDKIELVRRLKPLYPIVLCEGFVWIPGVLPDYTTGERLLMAVWAALLSAVGYQLVRRFVKQKTGADLPEDPNKLVPGGAAEDEGKDDDGDGDGEEEAAALAAATAAAAALERDGDDEETKKQADDTEPDTSSNSDGDGDPD
jgi:hypothetical protein